MAIVGQQDKMEVDKMKMTSSGNGGDSMQGMFNFCCLFTWPFNCLFYTLDFDKVLCHFIYEHESRYV